MGSSTNFDSVACAVRVFFIFTYSALNIALTFIVHNLDIEKAIGAIPIETLSVHPSLPLFDACREMLKTRARRIPLVDVDDETGRETIISVITQYRILKFIRSLL